MITACIRLWLASVLWRMVWNSPLIRFDSLRYRATIIHNTAMQRVADECAKFVGASGWSGMNLSNGKVIQVLEAKR